MLDPRGYPVAGAAVTSQLQNGPDDTGALQFQTGTSTLTTMDGYAITQATVTAAGKVQFGPVLTDTILASSVVMTTGDDGQMMEMRAADVPRYQPIAHAAYAPLAVDRTGALLLRPGPITRLPKESLLARTTSREAPSPADRASRAPKAASPALVPESSPGGPSRGLLPLRQKPLPEATTSCNTGTFTAVGVTATVNAPFTATLRDVTAVPGKPARNDLVTTAEGIVGHRVTNEVRLRLTIKDASQQEPTHPVLVTISLAGTNPGTLILDPGGLRIRCREARFVWHERDAQGNLLPQKNEEIGYELGTRAAYVGAIPDPSNPGQVKPVWGTAEALALQITSPGSSGSQDPSKLLSLTFPVHPEPWKPDHFGGYDTLGQPMNDQFPYWAGYLAYQDGTIPNTSNKRYRARYVEYEAYFLYDQYENVTFGYTNAAITRLLQWKLGSNAGPTGCVGTKTCWHYETG